ncbi:hypothetical protein EYZ11_013221 [Aspergillus tanneri]|uniref:Uncharacterized protein n=1 Tax=Aspergillus tanneri TaxID=1220188 RepID=A0A4S3IYQ4_9EURO|nr:hypothetical protein EYZ11_013221 [Aspergillus tanneri]
MTAAEFVQAQVNQALERVQAADDVANQNVTANKHATESVERLIHRACTTVADRRVNEFDQTRVNTLLQRPAIWDRPIQIHLKPATYRRYIRICQRLTCFAYHTSRPDQSIVLRHQPTTIQLAAVDRMEKYVLRLHGDSAKDQAELDSACLALSIALLDHTLKGDLALTRNDFSI